MKAFREIFDRRRGYFCAGRGVSILSCVLCGLLSLLVLLCVFAEAQEQTDISAEGQAVSTEPGEKDLVRPRRQIPKVKTVSFFLLDGRNVKGRVISEDAGQITIAELVGSKIIQTVHNRNDIAPKSSAYETMPETKYWETTAAYFLNRTWDFIDDPDDFSQAIRCLENAKQIVSTSQGEDHALVEELQEQIDQVRAEKERWIAEVESRSKLKLLELESTIEQRLKEMRELIEENTRQLYQINAIAAEISSLKTDTNNRFTSLQTQIAGNEREIRELWRRSRYYPHIYTYKRESKEEE
ncbi:MAG: hypothetical protein ABIG61_06900 [Planctomycetota bacterium]